MSQTACEHDIVDFPSENCCRSPYFFGYLISHSLENQLCLLVSGKYHFLHFSGVVGCKISYKPALSDKLLLQFFICVLSREAHLCLTSCRQTCRALRRKRSHVIGIVCVNYSVFPYWNNGYSPA